MRCLVIVSVFLLLAGCLSPSPAEDDNAPVDGAASPSSAERVVWSGCDQWHLHFDARAEDFAADTPPGYTVTADEAGLTTLLIHITLCPDIEEAYLGVPMTPPADHDDPDRLELATIQVFHAGHGTELYPPAFHPRLVKADFDVAATPAGPSLTVTGGGEKFSVNNVLNPSSGTFGGERWARIAHNGTAYGILNADGNESTSVGFGPVTYTHEGPGGAPPATLGITHIVTGLVIHMTSETRT